MSSVSNLRCLSEYERIDRKRALGLSMTGSCIGRTVTWPAAKPELKLCAHSSLTCVTQAVRMRTAQLQRARAAIT